MGRTRTARLPGRLDERPLGPGRPRVPAVQRAPTTSATRVLGPTDVLHLQRTVGNVAVQRLLGKIAPGTGIDLDAHEGAGGHTIDRHVGKSAEFIAGRVIGQQLDAASTFRDKSTAQTVATEALEANRTEVNTILFSAQSGPANRAFPFVAGRGIGSYLQTGNVVDKKGRKRSSRALKSGAQSVTFVVKILWQATPPHRWYLLTCFPNPR